MCGIKTPQQDFVVNMQGGGGLMHEGGAYLWDTMVLGICMCIMCLMSSMLAHEKLLIKQNGEARLRQRCAVLSLSHSQISERSELLRY